MDIEKLKKRCGYDGKSQQWQYGFDLACRELAKAQADAPGQITVTHERLQELITIAVKTVLDEREQK